jgi:hypothetical protein
MGPTTDKEFNYPNGYVRVYRGKQPINLSTGRPDSRANTHYGLLP